MLFQHGCASSRPVPSICGIQRCGLVVDVQGGVGWAGWLVGWIQGCVPEGPGGGAPAVHVLCSRTGPGGPSLGLGWAGCKACASNLATCLLCLCHVMCVWGGGGVCWTAWALAVLCCAVLCCAVLCCAGSA